MKVSKVGRELPKVGCGGVRPRVFTLYCFPR